MKLAIKLEITPEKELTDAFIKLLTKRVKQTLKGADVGSVKLASVSVVSDVAERARAGGLARSANLTPKQRSKIAKKAATARWSKDKE